jgi:multicomponent Na+:H+ antiporter subunit D
VIEHLPVLLVAVPLIAAPLAALLNRPTLSWLVAVAASFWALFAAGGLLARVQGGQVLRYDMGGWAPPSASSTASTR